MGWNRVRNRFTVEGKTGKLLMSGLQDNFHEAVGRKHGLERGEVGSAREHAPVDRELGVRIRVEEERKRTQDAKVQAGHRIAEVLERADEDAAQRYRDRFDDATRAAEAAGERAARATEERDEARRERDRAVRERDRTRERANLGADTLRFMSGELGKLKRENEQLRGAAKKVLQRLDQQDNQWKLRLDEQVAAAKQESADELTRMRRERADAIGEVGTLQVERDQARRERSQALQESQDDGGRAGRGARRAGS